MKKLLFLLLIILSVSCQEETDYNCGIVVGGESQWNEAIYNYTYELKVAYPDVTRWENVDEKTYLSFYINDVICF